MVTLGSRASDAHTSRAYMPCVNPMKAFWTGQLTDKGKLDLVIMPGTSGDLLNVKIAEKKSKTHRISPTAPLVKIGNNVYLSDPVAIPCSHCVGCRMDQAAEWKQRLCDEFRGVDPALLHFVTLTYGDWSLPVTKEGQPFLRKDDLRDFLHALRNPFYGVSKKLVFFSCGEYGEVFKRPHFHIVMKYELDDLIPYAWQCSHSKTIDKAWRHRGVTQVKPVEPNLIAYVCGYCEKKAMDPDWDSYPVKPFTLKSRGLGFSMVEELCGGLDRKVYGNYGGVHFASIPRAYLRKCENEPWFQEFKKRSIEIGKQTLQNNIGVFKTTDEEIMGFLIEDSIQEALQNKRISKI